MADLNWKYNYSVLISFVRRETRKTKLKVANVIAALMMLVMTHPKEVEGYIMIDMSSSPCNEQVCKDACIAIQTRKNYASSHCYGGNKYCICFG